MFMARLSPALLAISILLEACTGPPPLEPTSAAEQAPALRTSEPDQPQPSSQDGSAHTQTLAATSVHQTSAHTYPAASRLSTAVAIKHHTHSFAHSSPQIERAPSSTGQTLAMQLIPPPAAADGDEPWQARSSRIPIGPATDATAELATATTTPTQTFAYTPGHGTQCGVIYPDMREIGTPILRKVLWHQPGDILNPSARAIATDTKTMLLNMMSHPTRPIHPLAFFATIKHFESSAHIRSWGWYDFLFFGHLCTSGECSGYFQVDVQLEPAWSLDDICGMDGLDILGLKGGPDFCAALFWWLKGDSGRKCAQLGSGSANPCNSPGYVWDVSVFAQAYRAYGQANQWGQYGIHDSWGRAYTGGWVNHEYFMGYENCAAAYYATDRTPAPLISQAVAAFAAEINLEGVPVAPAP